MLEEGIKTSNTNSKASKLCFGVKHQNYIGINSGVSRISRGAPTYYLTSFFPTLHENEEILTQRMARVSLVPLDPPMAHEWGGDKSTSAAKYFVSWALPRG